MAAAGEDPSGNASGASEDAAPEAVPAAPQTTGTLLAAARVAAGLEIADVARTTRVPVRHLKALEADEHDGLPALPYAQGFVRAFATAVDLNGEDMCARFRAETSKQPHMPAPMAMTALDERRLPSSGLVAASLVALLVVIGLLSAWGAGAFDGEVPAIGAPVANEGDSGAASSTVPPVVTSETPDADVAGGSSGEALARQGPVVLTATEQVWARVFDPATDLVVFSGIMEVGQRFEVPASPPGLRLWTGRAGALAVTVAGQPLPPLGGAAEVLKDISLTPTDLMARAASASAVASAVASGGASGGAVAVPAPVQ